MSRKAPDIYQIANNGSSGAARPLVDVTATYP